MADKVFVGGVKVATTKFGNITKLSFNSSDLETLIQHKNSAGWVNVDLLKSKGGKPYMAINLFEAESESKPTETPAATKKIDDDLPF